MIESAAKFAFWSGVSLLGIVILVNFYSVLVSR